MVLYSVEFILMGGSKAPFGSWKKEVGHLQEKVHYLLSHFSSSPSFLGFGNFAKEEVENL